MIPETWVTDYSEDMGNTFALADTHLLAGKHLTQIDLAPVEAQPAAMRDDGRPFVKWVGQIGEPSIRTQRGRVELARHTHPRAWWGRSSL